MFYLTSFENRLRFGDILAGQISVYPNIKGKISPSSHNEYTLEVISSQYSVVLTPCCSIDDDVVVITPLMQVKGSFFGNPYFNEDLLRINKQMEPTQTVAPTVWNQFPLERQQEKLNEGVQYALTEIFIFDKHEALTPYSLKIPGATPAQSIETGHYMIDFRNTTKLISTNIRSVDGLFINKKIAQLTIEARSTLRDKIANFYSRTPKDDLIQED